MPASASPDPVPIRSSYRPDIDGLRAVAVMSVVLNHALPDIFGGGFVGVDIFYVISGYLITGILLNGLVDGRFSIADFYARRIRRILPALLMVLFFSSVFVLYLFPPRQLADYGKSLVATALFGSNIYFWRTTGYFTPEAHMIPLLHTWSLAIEEQYYVLFPPLLWIAWKLRRTNLFLVAGCAVSLLLSVALTNVRPTAAFYLLPTRAWELMLGAIVAAGILPAIARKHIAKVAVAAGALLLAAGFLIIDASSPFPGAIALLPCLGTALVIHAGASVRCGLFVTALSWEPVVAVGRMSYSLYLWHWPVISLLHFRFDEFTTPMAIAAIGLSMALAFMSWRYVECLFHTPPSQATFGRKPHGRQRSHAIAVGAASLMVVAGAGFSLMQLESPAIVRKFYSAEVADLNEAVVRVTTPSGCRKPEQALRDARCRIGDAVQPATIALWGDSYADALKPAFSEILGDRSAYAFILHSCPPILGTTRVDHRPEYRHFGEKCTKANQDTVRILETHPEIDTVVMFAQFLNAFDIPDRPVYLIPADFDVANDDGRTDKITGRIIDTVWRLKKAGKEVVLIGTFYAEESYGAMAILAHRMRSSEIDATMSVGQYDKYSKVMNDRLRKIADDRIHFIDPKPIFCQPGKKMCNFLPNGKPLLVDGGHLTSEGARRLAAMVAEALASPSGP